MNAEADIPEDRHGRILAELAGLSLELARDLQNRALEAESSDEAARLAAAFHSVSRGLRQTLALELKVAEFRRQQQRRADQDDASLPLGSGWEPEDAPSATDIRRDAIAACVERLIWNEHERAEDDEDRRTPRPHPDAAALQVRLDAFLDRAEQHADFATGDIDDQIILACRVLGLDPGRIYIFGAEPGLGSGLASEPERAPAPGRAPEPADTG